jgi:hypothetical protein
MEKVFYITESGEFETIDSDISQILELEQKRRVSHVVPVNRALRWLFTTIRKRVSDESRMAAFTRCWPCRWQAAIIGGPTLGPFKLRKDAISAEVAYINNKLETE